MSKQEQLSLSDENIEASTAKQEAQIDTKAQEKIDAILENASNAPKGPSVEDEAKMEEIRSSVLPKIEAIKEERSAQVEKFQDTRTPVEKQDFVQEKHPSKDNLKGIKKWMMALGFMGAMSTATANDGNKVEKDTVDAGKNKIEVGIKSSEIVTDQVREDWNDYLKWLDGKGMRGKEELNHNNLGYQLFDEYVATHPNTTLSREILPDIVSELEKMREQGLQDVADKKAGFAAGVNTVNFLSKVESNKSTGKPSYPGKNVTSTAFPRSKTVTIKKETIDYNKVANKAIDSKLQGNITNIMSDETKVDIKDEGFVKTKKETTTTKTDVAKNNLK